MTRRWEYKLHHVPPYMGIEEARALFNEFGAAGWELAERVDTIFYFKREIAEIGPEPDYHRPERFTVSG
jgi:hypothetical protein